MTIAAFLTMSFVVADKKNKLLNKHSDKYNVVLSSKFSFIDKGFGQQAVEGVCLALKIKLDECNGKNPLFKEGKISYSYPGTMDNISLIREYVDNFVETEGIDHFIMPGFTYTAFLQEWVFNNIDYFQQKGVNFIAIGTSFGEQWNDKWPVNFWQLLFEEYLPGYFAGLYAGVYALLNPDQFKDGDKDKSGKQIHFAALGGLWIPPILRYALGFKLGLESVNNLKKQVLPADRKEEKIEILFTDYEDIGGFDVDKYSQQVKFQATRLFRKGVSVIFPIAVTLTGAVHSVALDEDTNLQKPQHWVIGVDADQGVAIVNESPDSSEYKGKVLISGILKIRERLAKLIKDIKKGEYLNKANSKKNIIVTESKYLSVPDRFKTTPVWKKVENVFLKDSPEPVAEIKLMNSLVEKAFFGKNQEEMKSINLLLRRFLNNPEATFTQLDNAY